MIVAVTAVYIVAAVGVLLSGLLIKHINMSMIPFNASNSSISLGYRAISDSLEHLVTSTFILLIHSYIYIS